MTRLAIIAAILALSGCGSDCPTVDAQTIASQAYQQAERDINIGNLERLRGEMLVCRVAGVAPTAIQNILGLDCARDWAAWPDLNRVSADLPMRAVTMAVAILALAGVLLSILIPPIGRISGQWRAALEMRVAGLRARHERAIQDGIEIAKKRLRALEVAADEADSKAKAASARQQRAEALADQVEDEVARLRDELTERLRLAKAAETTADIANLLSSLDRRPD